MAYLLLRAAWLTLVKRVASVLAMLLFLCFSPEIPGFTPRSASAQSLTSEAESGEAPAENRVERVVSPSEWADLALERCRIAGELTQQADDALEQRLASRPLSREQAAFL